ncbi:hypothetical protein M0R45_006990 [Rubus argutus]|uniref:Uncharacterized protein n=1 Tax=Rubus argutus TaxID=59490 RepID=A0AAW1YSK8_RUBAR
MVVILGSGGRELEVRSACLAIGVGDPLGDLTLGKILEVRCFNSYTGVITLDSPLGRGCDFTCAEASAILGVTLHSRLLGFVGGGADFGGS